MSLQLFINRPWCRFTDVYTEEDGMLLLDCEMQQAGYSSVRVDAEGN